MDVGERSVTVRGIRLNLVEAGDGSLVVLLHGFPEFSYEWRGQLPALAGAGFHAVAPDQRGYGHSDKPKRVRDYRVEELAADVAAVIESFGTSRAALVGHDWGGIVAYYVAMLHPKSVSKLVIMNAPHPAHFERVLRSNVRQMFRSWYGVFFQLPWLPERVLTLSRCRILRRQFKRDAAPGAFTDEDLSRYVDAWLQPRAMRSGINWYRALVRRSPASLRALWRPIEVPTLVLWGDRDRHLIPELAEPGDHWLPNAELVRFPEASHWLPHDEPDRVNEALTDFLRRPGI